MSSSFAPSNGGQASLGFALIVEDNIIVALHVEAQLEDFGAAGSVIAGTVENALLALETRDIDFALVDVDLGLETSEEVAVALITRGVPFAFVTGYGESAALPARFPDVPVLMKPFSAEMLRALLTRLLG